MKHDKNQDINGLTCNFFHSPGITTVHLYHEQNPSNICLLICIQKSGKPKQYLLLDQFAN